MNAKTIIHAVPVRHFFVTSPLYQTQMFDQLSSALKLDLFIVPLFFWKSKKKNRTESNNKDGN